MSWADIWEERAVSAEADLGAALARAEAAEGELERLSELVRIREHWHGQVTHDRIELERLENRRHTPEEYQAAHKAWHDSMDAHDAARRALYSAVGLT